MKNRNDLFITGIATCFILLFVYAAITKLLAYEKFVAQVGQSPLLTHYAGFVAWFIPAIELLIAGLLVWPRFRLVGLGAALTLMIMFTGYIVAILGFSEHIPCSCGGVLESLNWRHHLVFNIGLVALACVGMLLRIPRTRSENT